MEEENIITVRNRNLQKADEAFADFMFMLESYLNEKAAAIPGTYCDCKSKELENVVVNVMKELCGRTPFRVEEIRLVSAQYFPDIIAEKYYGVEVKSTKENHWTSTGSSIVESTRDKNVENIYMLFGKLGGKTAEFKCRPYEDCLSDIAVTHSPRYLINMELTKEQTIFSKMGILNTYPAVILPQIAFSLSYSIQLFYSFSKFFPEEMLEAAIIDGCSPIGCFFKMVVPMSLNSIITVATMQAVFCWNEYINAYTFTRSTDMKTITLGLNDFVGSMGLTDWGATFAAITVTVLPVFIFYFFSSKKMLAGMTAGAVKG